MKLDVIYNKSSQRMTELPDGSIDLIATDPPYGIGFMGKEWDKFQQKKQTASQVVTWMSPTMKKDTRGMIEFFTPIWKECLRVLKPGAFAFIMCIPRQDCLARQIISLEDAGFIVSFTSIYWAYASGFPKTQNIGKAVDKRLGAKRKVVGIGDVKRASKIQPMSQGKSGAVDTREITAPATPQAQALDGSYSGFSPKPAVEVILVAMKPLSEKTYVDQALKNGKGITWLDGGRIPIQKGDEPHGGYGDEVIGFGPFDNKGGVKWKQSPTADKGRFPANLLVSDDVLNDGRIQSQGHWSKTKTTGYGKFGGGKSEYSGVGRKEPYVYKGRRYKVGGFIKDNSLQSPSNYNDSGSFSRYFSLDAWFEKKLKELPKGVQKTFPFFIVPKASKSEKNRGCEELYWEKDSSSFGYHQVDRQRWMWLGKEEERIYKETGKRVSLRARGDIHPTVKPLKLGFYLATIGSREGDIILDPFIGSGTTAIATRMLGRRYIGYEINKDYCEIASRRLEEVDPLFRRR